jgi:hypothetical protein
MEALSLDDVIIHRSQHQGKSCHRLGQCKIIDKERDNQARGIKEAMYIRLFPNLNRDEGRYQLSHLNNDIIKTQSFHTKNKE